MSKLSKAQSTALAAIQVGQVFCHLYGASYIVGGSPSSATYQRSTLESLVKLGHLRMVEGVGGTEFAPVVYGTIVIK